MVEIRQLHTERAAAGCADKETRRCQSRAKRKRGQVRAQLEEMYVWQGLVGDAVQRLCDAQMKQLYAGEVPPWGTPSSTALALRRHHGRLYCAAAADAARALEMEGFVRVEKVRLAAWLDGAEVCLMTARRVQLVTCPGRVFLLDRHLQELWEQRTALQRCMLPEPA